MTVRPRTLSTPAGRPVATAETIARAEKALGFRLPSALTTLLRDRNGGTPSHQCLPTTEPTSWAPDHVRISALLGVGYREGMDGALGSSYLVREWGYPELGVVFAETPSAGEDALMLDYRQCGPGGEPAVVFIEVDRRIIPLAASFSDFWNQLVVCK